MGGGRRVHRGGDEMPVWKTTALLAASTVRLGRAGEARSAPRTRARTAPAAAQGGSRSAPRRSRAVGRRPGPTPARGRRAARAAARARRARRRGPRPPAGLESDRPPAPSETGWPSRAPPVAYTHRRHGRVRVGRDDAVAHGVAVGHAAARVQRHDEPPRIAGRCARRAAVDLLPVVVHDAHVGAVEDLDRLGERSTTEDGLPRHAARRDRGDELTQRRMRHAGVADTAEDAERDQRADDRSGGRAHARPPSSSEPPPGTTAPRGAGSPPRPR